jgi:cell wall-associated NlpC family hydrolase
MTSSSSERYLVVTSALANLRRKPLEALARNTHDDLQETQLVRNEVLLLREEHKDWLYVEAIEQRKYTEERGWHGYPGWVSRHHCVAVDKVASYDAVVRAKVGRLLSHPATTAPPHAMLLPGVRLSALERGEPYTKVGMHDGTIGWVRNEELAFRAEVGRGSAWLREKVVESAKLFVGTPYLWGGRSMPMADLSGIAAGVDCSGLTNLAFRTNHVNLPRDARDQWRVTAVVAPDRLEPADLIFVSRERQPEDITHVMLYVGKSRFIEAAETGTSVKVSSFTSKFGLNLWQIAGRNSTVKEKKVYFGRIKRLEGPVPEHED